jgi:hypothetical protein
MKANSEPAGTSMLFCSFFLVTCRLSWCVCGLNKGFRPRTLTLQNILNVKCREVWRSSSLLRTSGHSKPHVHSLIRNIFLYISNTVKYANNHLPLLGSNTTMRAATKLISIYAYICISCSLQYSKSAKEI